MVYRNALAVILTALVTNLGFANDPNAVFQRQVRPLLAKHCFTCHGPDDQAREAGLRLDTLDGATQDLGGYQALKPGDAAISEMIVRVRSKEADFRMPPPDSGEPLTAEEIQVLADWINGGGNYAEHWAFVPPERPPVPATTVAETEWPWSQDPIDALVEARVREAGMRPSSQADRLTLARRTSLDITGLPPDADRADAFAADDSPMAYAKWIDRLMADPARGEKLTRSWLDLARYADTNGYEKDRPRSIWPYRDWVIQALAADMPFDQFSIEQIAGDMLPDATMSQRIATGFNRNTMLNEEGGIDPLEFRFQAMIDRVATVGTVWMGMTVGCAQCHTHKYDPITHTDFYSLMALLNNADEPELQIRDAQYENRLAEHDAKIAAAERSMIDAFPPKMEGEPQSLDSVSPDSKLLDSADHFQAAFQQWLDGQRTAARLWHVPKPTELHSTLPKLRPMPDGSIFADGDATKRDEYRIIYERGFEQPITAILLEVMPDDRLPAGGPGRSYYEGRRGDFFLSELQLLTGGNPIQLRDTWTSHGSLSVGSGTTDAANVIDADGSTGWSTSDQPNRTNWWVANLVEPLEANTPFEITMLFERHFAASLGRFRIWVTNADGSAASLDLSAEQQARLLASSPTESLETGFQKELTSLFLRKTPLLADARKPLNALESNRPSAPTTMVMQERANDNLRSTFRHHRGEYLSPKEEVRPSIPEFLLADAMASTATEQADSAVPKDRLELARWLASDRNPLVGRVIVNQIWRDFFGAGLVRTAGDFGTQSEPPTYPDVLDLMAVDFTHHWSLARLQRQIVSTATYQQSSRVSQVAEERDADNRLLARGPRFRMTGETIRDAALKASGTVCNTIGGPSVYPPQDPAVTGMAYGSPAWNTSQGGDRYRRSLYTFAKRTAPFAAYTVFDGPTGENCIARRDRSNTPLQSLTLLNDPMFVELAKLLAKDARKQLPEDSDSQAVVTAIFRRVLARRPTEVELKAMVQFVESVEADNGATETEGERLDRYELLARAILNLDEAVTKE